MFNEQHKKITYFLLGAVLFIFFWLSILTGFVIGVCEDVLALTETTPETEATIETTTIETAPDKTSIPETEETIPTESTEPIETEPVKTVPETTEAPVIEEPTVEIDPYELELLACVIYQEAGGDKQCDECRRRVADVVLNRMADPRFPRTMKGVLTAEGQYGNWSETGVVWPDRAKGDYEAVQRAYRIAREVLSGQHSDLYGNGYVWQARRVQGKDNVYCCGQYFGR